MAMKDKQRTATFSKGGKGRMFGPQAAEPAVKGHTADTTAKDNAPGKKFAVGGDARKLASGGAGAKPATAGRSGPVRQPVRPSTVTRDYGKSQTEGSVRAKWFDR
jgi:hypothetical protein